MEPQGKKLKRKKSTMNTIRKCAATTLKQGTIIKYGVASKTAASFTRYLSPSWLPVLGEEFKKEYFRELQNFIGKERQNFAVYPKNEEIFSWSHFCAPNEVKVVIIGQDPYHNPNQAHGLAFSVKPFCKAPPSLINIYKELNSDIPNFTAPNHGNLIGWAAQGVLLLNSVLTVTKNAPNSHKGRGWETLTDAVISHLSAQSENAIVFLLWGAYAQKKGEMIDGERHCILRAPHPSPFSARQGFFGCKHFSQANQFLLSQKRSSIDWNALPI